MLFGHGSWLEIRQHLPTFLDYLWRFAVSLAIEDDRLRPLSTYKADVVTYLRGAGADSVTREDRERALRFPSTNQWLLESHSFWLTLGHTTIEFGDFDRTRVIDGLELSEQLDWWLLHYYGRNTERVKDKLVARSYPELEDWGNAE